MMGTSKAEKWISAFLGVVCLLLVVNLVLRSGIKVGAVRTTAARASSAAVSRQAPAVDELAAYDPVVRVAELEKLQARSLPKLARNPFEFEARETGEARTESAAPSTPAPPPPPPPPPLKALGYTEKGGGVREAIVTDDQEIYVVHQGDTFAQRYRVLSISPAAVEIDDATTHQTVRLPISQ